MSILDAGIDLAKNVFALRSVNAAGAVVRGGAVGIGSHGRRLVSQRYCVAHNVDDRLPRRRL